MGADRDGKGLSGEVLFEFKQLGAQMRVTAIDAATSIEVVIIATLTATQVQIQNLALYMLKRRLAEAAAQPEPRRF